MSAKYAGIVYKDNDIQVLEDIINKMNEYGVQKVAEAFGKVSYRSAGNPKRSYRYVVGILQTEAEKEKGLGSINLGKDNLPLNFAILFSILYEVNKKCIFRSIQSKKC